ncbi:MAG: PAS domain S-box protein [Gammaproteobacteria bacterium]|nr:PAS domain S-box protein [Gammaproteobacteria bacterium]
MELDDRQLRALLDAAPDAIVAADADGVIVYVNAQAERLFGYGRAQMIGQGVEMLLPERSRAAHPAYRRTFATAPRSRPMGSGLDLRARRGDGTEFPVEISLSPLTTDRGLLVSSAIRDVSDRHAMLEALRSARAEADRANRAKSAFLAAASHDLRQPLQTLTLLNEALHQLPADPRAGTAIATQAQALASMSQLVTSLLDVSKLESGAIVPDIHDFSVRSVFGSVRAAFEEQARSKGLEFVVEDCEEVVRSDRNLLVQVLQNLVGNAIRYTRSGVVRLRCLHEDAGVRLEVLDTGIGIPAQQHQAIFEEFFQLNDAPGQAREGFGLGLAIVRRIAVLLSLSVEVDSAPGRGSRFAITVPRGAAPGEPHARERAVRPGGVQRSRILVIDDDPTVARATRLLLELEGHEAEWLAGVDDWRRWVATGAEPPDLIIAEVRLRSQFSGLDAIREIRGAIRREVPALLVTGDTSQRTADAAQACSRCELLSKPVVPEVFLEWVNRMLRSS